jgi:hypothetical protein
VPQPRNPPVLFIDHCLGTGIVAERLRREGVEVKVLVDSGFDESTEDAAWLPVAAARKWIILTKDRQSVAISGSSEPVRGALLLERIWAEGGDSKMPVLACSMSRRRRRRS